MYIVPERDNAVDQNALMVKTEPCLHRGHVLGYIPGLHAREIKCYTYVHEVAALKAKVIKVDNRSRPELAILIKNTYIRSNMKDGWSRLTRVDLDPDYTLD